MTAAPTLIPAIAADGSLHPVEKMAAHRQGILHQAVSVFVFCDGRLLIQRRAAGKYHCGGQWANSCCTHPHWGESHADAASRRLRQELGCVLPLRPRGRLTYSAAVSDGLLEHEEVQVYEGEADRHALAVGPDPDEVQDLRWESLPALRRQLRRRPDSLAPWFRIYLARWGELGFG